MKKIEGGSAAPSRREKPNLQLLPISSPHKGTVVTLSPSAVKKEPTGPSPQTKPSSNSTITTVIPAKSLPRTHTGPESIPPSSSRVLAGILSFPGPCIPH